ncbi:4839_t:CDS:1, partial [Funneliformis mosseae]
IEKTSEEICEILVNTHLNPDEDLIKIMDDDNDINTEVNSFGEKSDLIIGNTLNLDADVFINNLDKIIENSLEENLEGERNIQNVVEKENDTNIE